MNNYYTAVVFSATVLISSLQVSLAQEKWTIGTQQQWVNNTVRQQGVEIKNGQITPNAKTTIIKSQLKEFANKRNAATITINQMSGQIGSRLKALAHKIYEEHLLHYR
jgi:hypothetical protein